MEIYKNGLTILAKLVNFVINAEHEINLLPLYIANGITTVRDCSADISPSAFEWKAEMATGKLFGPNIFSSGPKMEGINSIWPGDQEVANETEIANALDSLEKLQADRVR